MVLSPASPESQRGKEPAQETALVLLDLRCFIGSPTDGPRLPSQQLRGGALDPGVLAEHARRLGWLMTPASPRAIPPFYRHSDHSMPTSWNGTGQRSGTAPAYSSIPQQPTTPS
jgi:hypothetical protein